MKNWKRVLIVSVLLVSILFSTARVAEAAPKGYSFEYSDVTVYVHGEAAELIKKAGKPQKKKAVNSCAYKGQDITYEYKDFTLVTYTNKKGGTEYIQSIKFKNKNVKTDKGIKIGSKKNTMLSKYGKKGTYNKLSGTYTYKKGKMAIQFTIENSKVTAIEYISYV